MTAATLPKPETTPARRPRAPRRLLARGAEALVFTAAVLVALLHAFDDAFLLPGGGVPLTQHALAFGARARGERGRDLWPSARCGPGVRAAIAFTLRRPRHGQRRPPRAPRPQRGQPASVNDVTGALALLAGVVLVGLAAWIPFRAPRRGRLGPARAGRPRVVLAWLSVVFVFGPVGMAIVDIHSLHAAGRLAAERRLQDRPLHGLRRRPSSRAGTGRRVTARRC